MKTKHTTGPWIIFDGTREERNLGRVERTGRFFGVVDDAGYPIAEVHLRNPQANVRLIAAAPEMLETLEILASFLRSYIALQEERGKYTKNLQQEYSKAWEIIHKARGEQ